MGYGRNAIWLAERGYEVEGWEVEARYVREARREARRRNVRLRARQGDFARGDCRGPYDVIVISQALHQLKRSAALAVLRRAKRALAPGGRLFLLAKLIRDRHVRRVTTSVEWERVPGERNTWRRGAPRGRREFHRRRPRRRWTLLSALTGGEIREALRGLKLAHYREVVLRSDWEENAEVTHTVAEVVAERQ
jgi:SAM-dependent methyltransferase